MKRHGRVGDYLAGCRCATCRAGHTQYYRDYREKKINAAVAVKAERWARIAESYEGVGCAIAARIRGGE